MTNPNTDYRTILNNPLSYEPENKIAFHRLVKKLLKQLHTRLEEDGTYGQAAPVRSNMGGIAVSGEVTLHTEKLYVQVSHSPIGHTRDSDILFRSCDGLTDYVGGQNNFAPIDSLLDIDGLARTIQSRIPFKMKA